MILGLLATAKSAFAILNVQGEKIQIIDADLNRAQAGSSNIKCCLVSRFVFKFPWFYLILNKFADAVTSLYLIWNQGVECFKVVFVSCCEC